MRKLVYHVATTLDNFIAAENGDVSAFLQEGDHIPDYLEHLKRYDTVVMGRATYEFGYAFGLKPGEAPYPHMRHYIFSKTLEFHQPRDQRVQVIKGDPALFISDLKKENGTDIYLCGGGAFAGYLFERELIDRVIVKLNPVLIGNGIRLFGSSLKQAMLTLNNMHTYQSGVVLLTYDIHHGNAG